MPNENRQPKKKENQLCTAVKQRVKDKLAFQLQSIILTITY